MKSCILAVGLLHVLAIYMFVKCAPGKITQYIVDPTTLEDINTLKYLKNETNYIIKHTRLIKNKPVSVLVKAEFDSEFQNILNSHDIPYKSFHYVNRTSGMCDGFYEYRVKSHNFTTLQFLLNLGQQESCILLKPIKGVAQTISLKIHPQFKIEFETMMKNYNISFSMQGHFSGGHEEGNYTIPKKPTSKHFLEYFVLPHDIQAVRYLRFLNNTSYCIFEKLHYRNISLLTIHPSFRVEFERTVKRFNLTYKSFDKLYKKPDLIHFCVYSIKRTPRVINFLQKLEKYDSCITRKMPGILYRNRTIATIHSESKQEFELRLKVFRSRYRLLSCFPRQPDSNNFRSYLISSACNRGTNALIAFGKETGAYKLNNCTYSNKITHPVKLKIHPYYKEDFEHILSIYRISHKLINSMPKEVDCSNYCAYLVKPQSEENVQALKSFLLETNYVFWNSIEPNQHIEIMILRELKEKFEDLLKTLNVEYESLMDYFEKDEFDNVLS